MAEVTDRARTPLLTLITQESLDRDYQVVADKRAGDPPDRRRSRWAVVAVVGAFALLVTVAAVQTTRNADDADASRARLIDRIESRRVGVQQLQARVEDLRSENATADEALIALGGEVSSAESRRIRLAADTGFAPVTGPGIRVVVNNPEFIDPDNVLRDSDLAMLVDGLWAVGAEAVSINGQRLTARSGIRNSGTPIEVNSIGIAPPYNVQAIGDVDRMAADFVESDPGQDFLTLVAQYGYTYEIDNVAEMRLPAAPDRLLNLRYAEDATIVEPDRGGGS
ncbi:DUF881 domain-containing protein [Nocardioides sambongensis]|uniref:DUF881 domain-containing protein n=1 Tax=Nocardioides sambongensis TaxID=2589074 RepID=UPI001129E2F2|nr:DUF881 domain-containing protein [Nocardioides sambongensis]